MVIKFCYKCYKYGYIVIYCLKLYKYGRYIGIRYEKEKEEYFVYVNLELIKYVNYNGKYIIWNNNDFITVKKRNQVKNLYFYKFK